MKGSIFQNIVRVIILTFSEREFVGVKNYYLQSSQLFYVNFDFQKSVTPISKNKQSKTGHIFDSIIENKKIWWHPENYLIYLGDPMLLSRFVRFCTILRHLVNNYTNINMKEYNILNYNFYNRFEFISWHICIGWT